VSITAEVKDATMLGDGHARGWEYCCLGPADSFQGLLGELKAKADQGWELSGVRNESFKVYATVKRPVAAPAAGEGRPI
jgi:hypothetical protein